MGDDVETISLTEAAERLDVRYMTAYRYVRTGRLHATKKGGQWVVPVSEVVNFNTASETNERPVRGELIPKLLEARLLAGDENGSFQLLDEAHTAGASPEELFIDLLAPAMASVGQRWHDGEISIADEHLATATALRVVGRFGPKLATRGRSRGTIILAGVSDDHHSVPTAMLRDLLRSRRFDVLDLGAHTPVDSIIDRAKQVDDLVAVGIAVTNADNERTVTETLQRLDGALSVPVILGGGAIQGADHARSLGPCTYSESARHALELFDAAHRAASEPK